MDEMSVVPLAEVQAEPSQLLRGLITIAEDTIAVLEQSNWDADAVDFLMGKRLTLFAQLQATHTAPGAAPVGGEVLRLVARLRDLDDKGIRLAQRHLDQAWQGLEATRWERTALQAYVGQGGRGLSGKGYYVDHK